MTTDAKLISTNFDFILSINNQSLENMGGGLWYKSGGGDRRTF